MSRTPGDTSRSSAPAAAPADPEWRELENLWRRDEEPPAPLPDFEELRAKVRRQSLGLVAVALAEIVFALAMITFLIRQASSSRDPSLVVAAVFIACFFVAAFAFAYWNRRGLWRARSASSLAFVTLLQRRAAGRLRTVRFSVGLLAAQCLFFAVWVPWRIESTPGLATRGLEPYLFAVAWTALIVLVYAVALAWMARRSRRELRQADDLLDQLSRTGDEAPTP